MNNQDEEKGGVSLRNYAEGQVAVNANNAIENLSFYDVWKRISKLAIPMGLSFTYSFEVFLSVLFINALANTSDESAAATLVSVLMNTVCVTSMSPLFAGALVLSNHLGELRENSTNLELKNKVSSMNANLLLIALGISTPIAFFPLFFSKDLLVSVFQQNSDIAGYAQDFLRIYSFAIPGLMARMGLEQIMFGFGKTKPAMYMGISSFAVGTLIAAGLGFGVEALNIPKMGSQGVATGFVIESYLIAIAFAAYVYASPTCRDYKFFHNIAQNIKNNKAQLSNILSIGGAITFTNAVDLAMILSVGIFSGIIGTDQQSAMSFIMQFVYFQFVFLAAFSFSTAQEVSREIGAKKYHQANQIAKYGLLTTMSYMVVLPVIFAAYPKALEAISGNGVTSNVSNILKTLTPIMALAVVLDAVRFHLNQQLRACNDLSVPSTIAFSGMSVTIILAATLGLDTSLGINGEATGYALGLGITAVLFGVRWYDQVKETKIGQVQNTETCISILTKRFGNFRRSSQSELLNPLIEEKENEQKRDYSSMK